MTFDLDVVLKFACNGILQELEIDFTQYEHPVVLTVEAAVSLVVCCFNFGFTCSCLYWCINMVMIWVSCQLKYVGHVKGAFAKNLFLKVNYIFCLCLK